VKLRESCKTPSRILTQILTHVLGILHGKDWVVVRVESITVIFKEDPRGLTITLRTTTAGLRREMCTSSWKKRKRTKEKTVSDWTFALCCVIGCLSYFHWCCCSRWPLLGLHGSWQMTRCLWSQQTHTFPLIHGHQLQIHQAGILPRSHLTTQRAIRLPREKAIQIQNDNN